MQYISLYRGVFWGMLIFCLCNPVSGWGQSPYDMQTKKELAYTGAGLGLIGLGAYQRVQTESFTESEIARLSRLSLNSFDRSASRNYSLDAHHLSDVFWYGSFATPLLFLSGKKSRKHFGQIALLWGEAVFINSGLTILTKYTVRRARPFVYNHRTPLEKKLSPNAKGSFFSGHTSMTATNTFFMAKVFADFYPDSSWKPVVWATAATIPAITAYLRVKGGRHYPTDVFVGYLVGGAVGVLVPHWHKKRKNKSSKWQLDLGYNAARLTLRLD